MKKIFKNTVISILGASLVSMSVPSAAFAEAEESYITVSLRIEGIFGNVFDGEVTYASSDETVLASDILKYADEGIEEFDITWTESDYGAYITAVNGEAEGTFEAWDGWMYRVNGETPSVSVSSYDIKDGDEIVLYYAYMDADTTFQYPTYTLDASSGTLRFTSLDTVGYDENWNSIVEECPVEGMEVCISDVIYITDENGEIQLIDELNKYTLNYYNKVTDDGAPLVLRPSEEEKFTIRARKPSISVIGIDSVIDETSMSFFTFADTVTVEDILRCADDELGDELDITWTDSGYGAYISAVNGVEAGTYGAWDGWMYQVDGETPSVGVSNYEISGTEEIVLCYAYMDEETIFQYPVCEFVEKYATLNFTSYDTTGYDEDWNPIVSHEPVAGLTVTLYTLAGDEAYEGVTDEYGKIYLYEENVAEGSYLVTYDKRTSDGAPLVLRQELLGAEEINVDYSAYMSSDDILPTLSVSIIIGNHTYTSIYSVGEEISVEEALRDADETYGDELEITWTESDYGAYVSAVNGLEAGTYGAWDGWMYQVNGEVPSVGVSNYYVSDGDSVILYYIYQDEENPAQNPKYSYDSNTGVLKFTSLDTTGYDEDWNAIVSEQPVAELYVRFCVEQSDETGVYYRTAYYFETDENGEINLRENGVEAGEYIMDYSKETAEGAPMVLPYSGNIVISYDEAVTTTTTTNSVTTTTTTSHTTIAAEETTVTTTTTTDKIADVSLGDVNNDGAVDALDASEILTIYAKSATGEEVEMSSSSKLAADVDTNGAIDALDASFVLSYYAYTATGGKSTIEEFLSVK